MAPLAANLHKDSSILDQSAYQRDQHLQDLYVLALFSKMSKRKPTARQTEQAKIQMAKEMHKFTERLYNPVQPNCEVSHTGKKSPFNGLDVVKKPIAEQRLSMIGEEGQVLWECESSDPVMGNTLFVFKAEIDGRTVKVMFDSGASGNFIPKFIADKYNLTRESCPAVNVTVASNTTVSCTERVTIPLQVGAYKTRVSALKSTA